MERIIRENLLAVVAAYRKATGKSLTQCSKEMYGNAYFFEEFRRGKRSVTLHQLDKIMNEFRRRFPDDASWPALRVVSMGRSPQQ